MQANTENYIHCPEGRVVRFEVGKTPYQGLCTNDFSICAIFCYQSKDLQRLSLVHVSRVTNKALLQEEIRWIGEGGRCSVYSMLIKTRSLQTAEEILVGLEFLEDADIRNGCHYELKPMNKQVEWLMLKADGQGQLHTKLLDNIKVRYHPNYKQLHNCAKLNEHFSAGLTVIKQTLVLFDGTSWQQLHSHDLVLCPYARDALHSLKISPNTPAMVIYDALYNYALLKMISVLPEFKGAKDIQAIFDELPEDIQIAINNPPREMLDTCIFVSHFIQLHTLRNNGVSYFKRNVQYELECIAPPTTAEDRKLFKELRSALEKKDLVTRVCDLLKPLDRATPFRDDIVGLILGGSGYFEFFNRTLNGEWLDLSSLESFIDKTEDLEAAFRYTAVYGTVQQLTLLAKVVNNIDAVGPKKKTALEYAVAANKSENVTCLLGLGAKLPEDEHTRNSLIETAKPECKLILENQFNKLPDLIK
ncbi:MAG: hypothetical protein M3R00_09780 [Pseudomonadota bacterium]|nr:hypothetical protein [Pseudomonadota bacterium]